MGFDITNSNQSAILESRLKAALYESLKRKVEKRGKPCIFLLGIGYGISSSLMTVAKQIALIFENLLKGLINIFGCCCVNNATFLRGVKQLIWGTSSEIIILPFSLLTAIFGVFAKPYHLVRSPSKYSDKMWLKHDPIEEKARDETNKITEFNQTLATVQQYPSKVEALKKLASYYHKGYGTTLDRNEAIKYYKLAAENGDVHSMKTLGEIFETSINDEAKESFDWYSKAAALEDVEAMYKMGLYYWNLEGKRLEGYDWLSKAAEKKHEDSKDFLKKLEQNSLTS